MRRALAVLLALATAGCIDAPRSGGDGKAPDAGDDAGDSGVPMVDAGSELLRNPGFEEGAGVGWVFEPGGSPRIATSAQLDLAVESGDYAAEVGGNNDQNDVIRQVVDVPDGTVELLLVFHHCVLSEEPEGDEWDFCDVRVAAGADMAVPVYRESNLDATPSCGWLDAAVAVPFMPGEKLEVLLIGTNDDDAPTRCLYDSFSLNATLE